MDRDANSADLSASISSPLTHNGRHRIAFVVPKAFPLKMGVSCPLWFVGGR